MRTRMGVAESISVIFWSRFRWYQDSLRPRAAPASRPSLLQRFDEGRERGVVSQLGEGFVVDWVWHLLAGGEILFVGEGLPQMGRRRCSICSLSVMERHRRIAIPKSFRAFSGTGA